MGRLTELRERGADLGRLKTDQQRRFVLEWLIDRNQTQAAIRAGYSKKTAHVIAVKLMKNPIIKAYIGKLERLDVEQLELDRWEVLRQLWYCLTKRDSDFRNADGSLIPAGELSERAECVIDGYDVEEFIDKETGEVYRRKTKIRTSPKAVAIEQAMKHKGLFAAVVAELNLGLNPHQKFLDLIGQSLPPDEIEERLKLEHEKGAK